MLIEIPLSPIPNQTISTIVNQQQITVNLYQRSTGLFCDVYLGATLIIGGMKCNNAEYLNQYPTAFVGYLFFYTVSGNDPTYDTFGTDAHFFFSDYDALAVAYENWLIENPTEEQNPV